MWPFSPRIRNMRKRLFRDLDAVIAITRARRTSIERNYELGIIPFPQSARQVRKGAAIFTRLIEDVDWLRQELAWTDERNSENADPNFSFEEKLRAWLIVSLIKELQAPVAEYFEVMPRDPEVEAIVPLDPAREFLEETLRMVLEGGKSLAQEADAGRR